MSILEDLIAAGGKTKWVPVEYGRGGCRGLAMANPVDDVSDDKSIILLTEYGMAVETTAQGFHGAPKQNLSIGRVIPPRRSAWLKLRNSGATFAYVPGDDLVDAIVCKERGWHVELIFDGTTPVDVKLHPAEETE